MFLPHCGSSEADELASPFSGIPVGYRSIDRYMTLILACMVSADSSGRAFIGEQLHRLPQAWAGALQARTSSSSSGPLSSMAGGTSWHGCMSYPFGRHEGGVFEAALCITQAMAECPHLTKTPDHSTSHPKTILSAQKLCEDSGVAPACHPL